MNPEITWLINNNNKNTAYLKSYVNQISTAFFLLFPDVLSLNLNEYLSVQSLISWDHWTKTWHEDWHGSLLEASKALQNGERGAGGLM